MRNIARPRATPGILESRVEPDHFRYWPSQLPHEVELPPVSLYRNLETSAARAPGHTAINYYGSLITYRRLKQDVDALAGFLQRRAGVRRGDRVLLFMQNSPQFIVAYYAILRADAMVVPVNPMNLTEELRHYVEDSDATVAVAGQELFAQVQPLLGHGLKHVVAAAYSDYLDAPDGLKVPDVASAPRMDLRDPGVTAWHAALAERIEPGPHEAGPGDLCVMPYTSGTTGKPKGCIHTHRTVMATTVAGGRWVEMTQDSVLLGSMPMFHVTGMQCSMNQPIYFGATIVLMTRWDRDAAAELIQRYKVEGWTNIATMAIDFLSNPDLGRYDISSMKHIGGGGAAMPEAVAQRLRDMTGLDYIEGYGLSETIAPTHINPPQRPKKQCLGIPICSTSSLVIDPETGAVLGPKQTGEIVSRGPQIFLGYWKKPDATKAAFVDVGGQSYFRTGDLGYRDEDGYFFIVDRLKRMINASGYKVWPAEVETMLYHHPDIREACVIGTHDGHRGETVKALVVLKDASRGKAGAGDIIAWSRGKMAAYKVPRVVEIVDSLPKSATGKVQWRLLQEAENRKTTTSGP
ncbi:MAG TPA: long-chain fatty acid--CoA ligase [Burkholderiales bacterium]|nr:long-chain fatty acid--CoA ligase [Burkholderiales bacterium]